MSETETKPVVRRAAEFHAHGLIGYVACPETLPDTYVVTLVPSVMWPPRILWRREFKRVDRAMRCYLRLCRVLGGREIKNPGLLHEVDED